MADSSLSWQTTMPDKPDVSYQAYKDTYGYKAGRLTTAIGAWLNGDPSYSTWRQNVLDDYNMQMSAYNTWLQTGEGQRASLESGDYNPSYSQGVGSAQASPLDYQDTSESSGLQEIGQGISGFLSLISAVQGIRMMGAKIAGQEAQNNLLGIEAQYRDRLLYNKAGLSGFKADAQKFLNEQYLYSMYHDIPEITGPNGAQGVFTNYGEYDLSTTGKSLAYQKGFQDLEMMKAAVALRQAQKEYTHWNAKEREFYVNSIQTFVKDLAEWSSRSAKGAYDFQATEQKLRKQATQWGIGLNVANTAIGLAKSIAAFVPGGGMTAALSGPNFMPSAHYTPSPYGSQEDYLSAMFGVQ